MKVWTGNFQIDALIDEYLGLSRYIADMGEEVEIGRLVEAKFASGICDLIADDFASFCQQHGLNAFSPDTDPHPDHGMQSSAYQATLGNRELVRFVDDNAGLFDLHGPDVRSWYPDAPTDQHPIHHVTIVEAQDGKIFFVDFTAAQYGLQDLPQVRQLTDAGWSAPRPVMDPIPLTGDVLLDQAIAEFARLDEMQDLRQPEVAKGACGEADMDFRDFLAKRGINDFTSSDWGAESHGWLSPPRSGLPFGYSPDDFGYTDRTLAGEYDHVVTLIKASDGEIYMVDFTAAQYGYTEFPLIQRQTPQGWERLSERPALTCSDAPPAPAAPGQPEPKSPGDNLNL